MRVSSVVLLSFTSYLLFSLFDLFVICFRRTSLYLYFNCRSGAIFETMEPVRDPGKCWTTKKVRKDARELGSLGTSDLSSFFLHKSSFISFFDASHDLLLDFTSFFLYWV